MNKLVISHSLLHHINRTTEEHFCTQKKFLKFLIYSKRLDYLGTVGEEAGLS